MPLVSSARPAQVNTLDQLCINFANEILQNQFNERIFVLEKRLYEEEEIDITDVVFKDNSGVIELIAGKPRGIFALLEEQVLIPLLSSPCVRPGASTPPRMCS